MSSSPEITQPTSYVCGNCKTENAANTKFCEGCGHHLTEPCDDCGKTVTLSQKFCGKCGANLEKANQQRFEQYEKKLTEAIKQTKLHEYEHALALTQSLSNLDDYRFRSIAEQAAIATGKIEDIRNRTVEEALARISEAKKALADDDSAKVVSLLENVPNILRDTEVENILQRAKTKVSETQVLQDELRTGITEKNWLLVGSLLEQLLDRYPMESRYKELAQKVRGKLMRNAKSSAAKGNFSSALESLNAIPTCASTQELEKLAIWASKADWCAEQVKREPFATPILGRMALTHTKSAPKLPHAELDVKELASLIKSNQFTTRCPLPRWKPSNKSWLGGEFLLLGLPQMHDFGKHEAFRANPGQLNVAVGLAIQGLGHGRITCHFASKKKKLLGSRRKKPTRCWGLDIGTAAIKAVLLEEKDGSLKILDTFFEALPTPTCRKSAEADTPSTLLLPALMKFAREKSSDETSVWAGFPSGETVTHFVSIPSVKEKLTQQLLEKEISQKVPLPREDIEVAQWIGEADPANLKGRPVTLSIARKKFLHDYIETLTTAGINVSGLQCDSLALLNFATSEFSELLKCSEDDSDQIDAKDAAIAFLNCGASSTTLLVVSRRTHWYWTMERGSEAVNSLIARQAKVTLEKAEELKRNPTELADPASQYAPVENSFLEVRARLEVALKDMLKQNDRIDITSTWCMGGGSLTHQWMRLVAAQEESS